MERAEIMSDSTTDMEKVLHKIQYHFMIQTLNNQEGKRNFLNLIDLSLMTVFMDTFLLLLLLLFFFSAFNGSICPNINIFNCRPKPL